jgi:hypothetical protein
VTKLWTSRGDKYSASKLLGEAVTRQVTGRVAGRVAPYIEPSSDKALDESLGESLLGESLLGELVGKSLGESLEEFFPTSNHPVTKLLRPSHVPTERERGERAIQSGKKQEKDGQKERE